MRVVFKKRIDEKLYEAFKEARQLGREIEKFVITLDEARQLEHLCEQRSLIREDLYHQTQRFGEVTAFCGIPLEVG